MSALRSLLILTASLLVISGEAVAGEPGPQSIAPAFVPMPIPELMATAASPDRESAARALSSLLAMGRTSDEALLVLLESGTTQDARIALHVVERPDAGAIPALLAALGRHDDGTRAAEALTKALRASVPLEYAPPEPVLGVDGAREEDSRAWRDWARRHQRTETAACLGRTSLSIFPLAVMLVTGRGRRRD